MGTYTFAQLDKLQDVADAASQEPHSQQAAWPIGVFLAGQGLSSVYTPPPPLSWGPKPSRYLQQLLWEVATISQAMQVGYEFLAAHALADVLCGHGEKWDS